MTILSQGERRLAAIMYTDMVGYTALGQRNESLSIALVEEQRKLIRPILARHHGREIKTMGDAFLVEFPNALDAVRCGYDIQRATREFNISLSPEKRIHLRIGLHLGDVVESKGDISGDAVNVASRIYPLAEDGGVCITRQVYDQVKGKFELPQESIGLKTLKNVAEPIEVFKIVMAWEQSVSYKETTSLPRDRIAILPFANMSPDPNDEYFADGMTEEIISTASGISGLNVISRTSVMHYKKTEKTVREIGKELEVGSVLEGSFRKAGNRIRVTTQLIDVAADRHLWAQNYDRNLDDIFAVQTDVAKQVADALRVKILSPEKERLERKPTESTAAYSLYLKGMYYWNRRGVEDVKRALEYFELAVHEDPKFALGYVGQSDCYGVLSSTWGIDHGANRAKSKAMADTALELDPELAEAHASHAFLTMEEYDYRKAEEEFRRAIQLKPNYSTVHMWYSFLLGDQQRWEEATEQIGLAEELDPMAHNVLFNYGAGLAARKEWNKAVEKLKRATELGSPYARLLLGFVYGKLKMYDDMKREFAAQVELWRDLYPLAWMSIDASEAYLKDDKQGVRRLLPELEAHMDETGLGPYEIATYYFYLGENDKGFQWLERAYSEFRIKPGNAIKSDEFFDGIRTDPRYLDLLKRLGLS
jgi:TolB-like protein/class 3 adenylate cyclase/tetratricopeptide (TPR) repeat protein